MKTKPLISVVMPNYNCKRYLSEAIKSILNQTFKDFEFIIIDDGSTDGSVNIINKYVKKDKRIIFIQNKNNLKLPRTLNRGLKKARGKYVARMDSDDISLPNRFQKQYDFLEKNKEIFLVGGRIKTIDEKGNFLNDGKIISNMKKIMGAFPDNHSFCHPTIMFRNEGYLYRPKFHNSEDKDFYLRLFTSGKIMTNIKDIVLRYRIRLDSQSFASNSTQSKFSLLAKKFCYQRLKNGQDEYAKMDVREDFNLNDKQEMFYREIFICYYGFNLKLLKIKYKEYRNKYNFNFKLYLLFVLSLLGRKFNVYLRRFLVLFN